MSNENSGAVHFLATSLWALFALVYGVVSLVYGQNSQWVNLVLIVAIAGNSAHLIAFAISPKGAKIVTVPSAAPVDISGRDVVNGSGQIIGKVK